VREWKNAPVVIRGPLDDLSDVLRIARVEGKKIFKVDKIKVKPIIYPFGNDYLVVVEPDGLGCSKAPAVGGGTNNVR